MADRPSNTDSSLVLGDAVPLNGDSLLNKISQAEKDVKLPHGVDLALSVVKSGDLKMAAGAGLLGQLKPACAFHAIRPPSPPTSGHPFHAHPARQSERSDAGLHC